MVSLLVDAMLESDLCLNTVEQETLANFLIWRFGELGKDHQIESHKFKQNACKSNEDI